MELEKRNEKVCRPYGLKKKVASKYKALGYDFVTHISIKNMKASIKKGNELNSVLGSIVHDPNIPVAIALNDHANLSA